MKEMGLTTEAGQQYASTYDAHCAEKDIQKAFTLYGRIVATLPDTPEAGYARAQLQNSVWQSATNLKARKSPSL